MYVTENCTKIPSQRINRSSPPLWHNCLRHILICSRRLSSTQDTLLFISSMLAFQILISKLSPAMEQDIFNTHPLRLSPSINHVHIACVVQIIKRRSSVSSQNYSVIWSVGKVIWDIYRIILEIYLSPSGFPVFYHSDCRNWWCMIVLLFDLCPRGR
jgi:hypothetical protein